MRTVYLYHCHVILLNHFWLLIFGFCVLQNENLENDWEGLVDHLFLRRHLKTGVLGVLDRRASPRNLTSRRILYDVGGVMGGITRRWHALQPVPYHSSCSAKTARWPARTTEITIGWWLSFKLARHILRRCRKRPQVTLRRWPGQSSSWTKYVDWQMLVCLCQMQSDSWD